MNGLGKPFKKNPIKKIEKTVKIKVKLRHVNKKPLTRKNLEQKNFAAKRLAFSLHCFGVTKITTPI